MAEICHICGKGTDEPLYPDPCCGAPDCPNRNDMVHYNCASVFVRAEIDEEREIP